MNIQEIANEHSREIIKNIFSKLDDEEKYVILELNNQLQDKISKIDKAIEYIKNNCVLSDEWRDLGFCNFIPTGKITYKQLTPKKVKELLEILGD